MCLTAHKKVSKFALSVNDNVYSTMSLLDNAGHTAPRPVLTSPIHATPLLPLLPSADVVFSRVSAHPHVLSSAARLLRLLRSPQD